MFDDYTKPIPLDSGVSDHTVSNAVISGWGFTMEGYFKSRILQYIWVPVMSHEDCGQIWNDFVGIKPTSLCTDSQSGTGACKFDPGGPLVTDNQLIGVVSYGGRGCGNSRPDVFARVSEYRNWINEKMAKF